MSFSVLKLQEVLGAEPLAGGLPAGGQGSIAAVADDSRRVSEQSVFVALKGAEFDGHAYIESALRQGAIAVVVEQGVYSALPNCAEIEQAAADSSASLFAVPSSRLALAVIASEFYGQPSDRLSCIGVTGTNGKTSISWIIGNAVGTAKAPCAYLGTLGIGVFAADTAPRLEKTITTTPDALSLQSMLAESLSKGASAAVVEVTSQGLAQERTAGVNWDLAVFSNLTRDHLDLHDTMEVYAECKRRLFIEGLVQSTKKRRAAVINIDDNFGQQLANELEELSTGIDIVRVSSLGKEADVAVASAVPTMDGTKIVFEVSGAHLEIESKLVGSYNVENLALSTAVLLQLGYSLEEAADRISGVAPVPGRLERVSDGSRHVYVDYCHTPDALLSAQQSLKTLCPGRLITVFGCGGDRDRGKRPLMAQAVSRVADVGIVTSDNPRSENAESIIDDIVIGFDESNSRGNFIWERIADRRTAIKYALDFADSSDIVLIAGKGHEDYQEIDGVRHPFCDRQVCRSLLEEHK